MFTEQRYQLAMRRTADAHRNMAYSHRHKVIIDGSCAGEVALFHDNTWRCSSDYDAPKFKRLRDAVDYLERLGGE